MKQKIRRLTAFLVALAVFTSFATCPNVEAATKLKVKSSKKITLNIGKTSIIKTNVAANKLKYTSSNKKVATVTNKGKITAKKAGKANITVTSKRNKKQKVTIKVTVINKKTTQATTTKSNVTTTTQQTSVVTTQSTSVTTTTQASEEATTTSGSATTEGTASGDATTEEPELVGITAEYRGDKIPMGAGVSIYGIDVYKVYNNDSKEKLDYSNMNFHEEYFGVNYKPIYEEVDGKMIATYTVSYKDFLTTFNVEVVSIEENIEYYNEMLDVFANNTGITSTNQEFPVDNITAITMLLNNGKTVYLPEEEFSKLKVVRYDDVSYMVIYEFYFEYQGEQIYNCVNSLHGIKSY